MHLHRLEVWNLSQVTIICKLHLNGIGWPRLTQISSNFELKNTIPTYTNDFSLEKWLKFARFRIKKVSNRQSFMINFQKVPKNIWNRILFFFCFFVFLAFISNICSQIWLKLFSGWISSLLGIYITKPLKRNPGRAWLWHGQTSAGNFGAREP